MKCPCCNNEMSAGVVQSAREIFFTTEANQNWLNPFLANKNKIMLSTNVARGRMKFFFIA